MTTERLDAGPSQLQALEQQQQRQRQQQVAAENAGVPVTAQCIDRDFFTREWEPRPFTD